MLIEKDVRRPDPMSSQHPELGRSQYSLKSQRLKWGENQKRVVSL
jgi:hypothetical protein